MGHQNSVQISVVVPNVEDFGKRYKQYKRRAQGVGKKFFDLVMTPRSFIAAAIVTEQLGLSAVAGIARDCNQQAGGELEAIDRQFIGALVCSLMLANGYTKTGKKKAIPEKGWGKGEVYALPEEGTGLVLNEVVER